MIPSWQLGTSKPVFNVLSLPPELKIEIMMNLDHRSLLHFAISCKAIHSLLEETSALQYLLDLARDGMVGGNSSLLPGERRLQLCARRMAWGMLNWKRVTVVPIGGECQAYELVGGTFSKSNGEDLMVVWLPSSTHCPRTIHWKVLEAPIRDFAIDPTQDLVITFGQHNLLASALQPRTVRIQIRTISTNSPHPGAKQPVLEFKLPPDPGLGNAILAATLELAHDVFAIFYSRGSSVLGPRILIWNWMEGLLLYDSEEAGLPVDVSDFSLLGRDSFLLTSLQESGSLMVYHLPRVPSSVPVHVVSLNLPPIQSTYRVLFLGAHSGPIHSNPPENAVFTTDTASHLHVISADYVGQDLHTSRFSLFVHNRVFAQYIGNLLSGSARCGLQVKWEDWGPLQTRFVPRRVPSNWLRYVHGQRVICASDRIEGVDILDFNVNRSPPGLCETFTRQNHSSVSKDRGFVEDVITQLPFYLATRAVTQRFYAYMIDEERIIGLKTSITNFQECMELHVYSF